MCVCKYESTPGRNITLTPTHPCSRCAPNYRLKNLNADVMAVVAPPSFRLSTFANAPPYPAPLHRVPPPPSPSPPSGSIRSARRNSEPPCFSLSRSACRSSWRSCQCKHTAFCINTTTKVSIVALCLGLSLRSHLSLQITG